MIIGINQRFAVLRFTVPSDFKLFDIDKCIGARLVAFDVILRRTLSDFFSSLESGGRAQVDV